MTGNTGWDEFPRKKRENALVLTEKTAMEEKFGNEAYYSLRSTLQGPAERIVS